MDFRTFLLLGNVLGFVSGHFTWQTWFKAFPGWAIAKTLFFYCEGQFSYRNLYFLTFVIAILIAKIFDCNGIFFICYGWSTFCICYQFFISFDLEEILRYIALWFRIIKTVLYPTAFLKILFLLRAQKRY